MGRAEDVQLELHREVVRKLRADAEPVLRLARRNIRASREMVRSSLAQRWLDHWQRLLTQPMQALIDMCLREDEVGVDMRQVSPFAGALTDEERIAAITRAQQAFASAGGAGVARSSAVGPGVAMAGTSIAAGHAAQ